MAPEPSWTAPLRALVVSVIYRFGEFELDRDRFELRRGGEVVRVEPRVLELLLYLVENRGRLVTKDELLAEVWGGQVVTESSLARSVSLARDVLDDREGEELIRTVFGRGYRFSEDVEEIRPAGAAGRWSRARLTAAVAAIVAAAVATVVVIVASREDAPRVAAPPPAAPEEPSIVVLPFVNMTPQADWDVLGDGLAEEIIHVLSQLEGVRVVARTSAFSFKSEAVTAREIGDRLGVAKVLQGSIRGDRDPVRVIAQLVDARDESHLWSQAWEGRLDDVLRLQGEVAAGVLEALRGPLQVGAAVRARRPTESLDAYRLYHQARADFGRGPEGVRRGMEGLDAAIAVDPQFALALALKAEMLLVFGRSLTASDEVLPLAEEAALAAIAADPTIGDGHASLCRVLTSRWDWVGARRACQEALRLSPASPFPHRTHAVLLWTLGKTRLAVEEASRAVELDPLDRMTNLFLGIALFFDRRFGDAIDQLHYAAALGSAEGPIPHTWLSQVYLAAGDDALAFEEALVAQELVGAPTGRIERLREIFASGGSRALRELELAELVAAHEADEANEYWLARAHARLGQHERAFDMLERAVRQRRDDVLFLKVHPNWDELRSSPRFAALLREIGLED